MPFMDWHLKETLHCDIATPLKTYAQKVCGGVCSLLPLSPLGIPSVRE